MTYRNQLIEEKAKLEILRSTSIEGYEEFNLQRAQYDAIDFNITVINKEIEIDGIINQIDAVEAEGN